MTEESILAEINKLIRTEHGTKVSIDSLLKDSGMDSFGFSMVIMELDNKYGCFDNEWFDSNVDDNLTVRTLVERVLNASN